MNFTIIFKNQEYHSIYNDIKYLLPEIFLISGVLLILVFIIFYSNINVYKYIKLVYCTINLLVFILILFILLNINNIDNNFIISSYLLYSDGIIFFYKNLLSIIMIILLVTSYNYMRLNKLLIFEFYILMLLSFIGMITLLLSYDFITAYLSIELQSLCFYILAAINRNKNSSIEAGLKYFILGSFSSSLLIVGIAIIYGVTGFTNFYDLSKLFELGLYNINWDSYIFIGLLFINIGLFFKLAIPPFHIWLPDIYEGSLKIVLAIFALLPKLAILIFFWKIYSIILIKDLIDWQIFFLIFILLSWFIGILGALQSKKFSRLIAYSSINHMGFILLILILNDVLTLTLYIIIYILALINILIIWLNIFKFNNYKGINTIYQFLYIIKSNNLLFIILLIAIFSLAGIPPLAGFFSKFFIFISALKQNYYLLVVIGLLFSVVSCFYYLRLIKIIMFNNSFYWFFLTPLKRSYAYIIVILFVVNSIFILLLPFLLEYLNYII